jgi:glycosyltransferase involved in cell wall biosynthesis
MRLTQGSNTLLLGVLVVGLVVVLFLFGDTRSRRSVHISPEKAAAIEFSKWPTWTTVEPPDQRIRILWVLHDYVPFVNAGSEICAHTINTHLMYKPYKFDVWVASPGFPKRTFENVRCFDLHDQETFTQVLASAHQLHSHSYIYRKQMLYLSRITGKPFVEWVHTDNYVRSVGKQWNDDRLEGRQWTVFNSKSLRSSRADLPEATTKIFLPIVDYRDYAIDKEKKAPKYVTLSNVNDNKGGNLLIQLAKALPDMEFQGILGGYRKQIVYSGLPNLKYVQHTTRIKDVYATTWVQIMPSKEETWGRTAVEAMSSGIPLVVSSTPGLRECCQESALYCDRADLDGWVTTLRKLKEDPSFYNSRSAVALERARALDPLPEMEALEAWLEKEVAPSLRPGRLPTLLEKNILFR